MESTEEFLAKLHDKQEKAEKNQKQQGKGNTSAKLPNKQHSTNK
ncbi:MAG: hypothetical protein JWM44_2569 [Bacilli bacterium]|nr:hypothetical protein [Bacilli bacterium]